MKKEFACAGAVLLTLSLASCGKNELKEQQKEFETFKTSVSTELEYKGDIEKSLGIEASTVPHVFKGETELSEKEYTDAGISPMKLNLKTKNVTSYDSKNNIFVKTVSNDDKPFELEEYYYVEDNVEYKLFMDSVFNMDTWGYDKVKARNSLDTGHIASLTTMMPVDLDEILEGVTTFDELLVKAGDQLHTVKGAEEYDMSGFSISTNKNKNTNTATMIAPLKFNLLGMDIDASATGTLTYTKDEIKTFVVDVTGSITQTETKKVDSVETVYTIKMDLNAHIDVNLKHEFVNTISEEEINSFKAIEAKPARKVDTQIESILDTSTIVKKGDEYQLPKNLQALTNCDVKLYKDKKYTEEVLLTEVSNKTYEQKLYAQVTPKEGYSLFIEVKNNPTDNFPKTFKEVKEIKIADTPKYTIQKNIEINKEGEDYDAVKGKPWSYIFLDGKKVVDQNEIAFESGKCYSIEYRYYAPKN